MRDNPGPRGRAEARTRPALAGRAAEEVVYGEVTTGAQNDFQQATGLARRMVTEWGMSGRIGKVTLADRDGARGPAELLEPPRVPHQVALLLVLHHPTGVLDEGTVHPRRDGAP